MHTREIQIGKKQSLIEFKIGEHLMTQRWTFTGRLGKLGTSFLFARKKKSNIGLSLSATAAGAHTFLGGVPERHGQVLGKRREATYPLLSE